MEKYTQIRFPFRFFVLSVLLLSIFEQIVISEVCLANPPQPQNFKAISQGKKVKLTWDPVPLQVGDEYECGHYKIYRGINKNTLSLIAEIRVYSGEDGVIDYIDESVEYNMTYYYQVAGVQFDEGEKSSIVEVNVTKNNNVLIYCMIGGGIIAILFIINKIRNFIGSGFREILNKNSISTGETRTTGLNGGTITCSCGNKLFIGPHGGSCPKCGANWIPKY